MSFACQDIISGNNKEIINTKEKGFSYLFVMS